MTFNAICDRIGGNQLTTTMNLNKPVSVKIRNLTVTLTADEYRWAKGEQSRRNAEIIREWSEARDKTSKDREKKRLKWEKRVADYEAAKAEALMEYQDKLKSTYWWEKTPKFNFHMTEPNYLFYRDWVYRPHMSQDPPVISLESIILESLNKPIK